MTNLTDKWKKGELPEETECYVRVSGDIYLGSIQYKNGLHNKKLPYVKSFNGQFITKYVEEVLAPVPTFDEYQKLLSDQLAKNEGVEINAELEAENTKLKELLKECNQILIAYEMMAKGEYRKKLRELIAQINQVLGEE